MGGVAAQDIDILSFDGTTWSMFFDGSDVGINTSNQNLKDFHILDADTLLLTFDEPITFGTLTVDPWDVVRFDATSLGNNTAGTFSMYLDGNDVGLETTNEYIDGLHVLPDGRVLISTDGNPTVSGLTGTADEDILAFTSTTLGDVTSGTWAMYFDGSDVGLADSSSEDTDALDMIDGNLYLSTRGDFSVTDVAGVSNDIFVCLPTSLGSVTSCNFQPALYFDGDIWGLGTNNIDALGSPASGATPTATPTGTPTATATPSQTFTPSFHPNNWPFADPHKYTAANEYTDANEHTFTNTRSIRPTFISQLGRRPNSGWCGFSRCGHSLLRWLSLVTLFRCVRCRH